MTKSVRGQHLNKFQAGDGVEVQFQHMTGHLLESERREIKLRFRAQVKDLHVGDHRTRNALKTMFLYWSLWVLDTRLDWGLQTNAFRPHLAQYI